MVNQSPKVAKWHIKLGVFQNYCGFFSGTPSRRWDRMQLICFDTSAPKGAWKWHFLGNYDRRTNQRTDKRTNRAKGNFHLCPPSYDWQKKNFIFFSKFFFFYFEFMVITSSSKMLEIHLSGKLYEEKTIMLLRHIS